MKLTDDEHKGNARDWIGMSIEPLEPNERVDRNQLREQLQYTDADNEDVEIIACLIEKFSEERRIRARD